MRQSAVNTFLKCPYQYKLQYVDQLKIIPDPKADDARTIGTAIHMAAELGLDPAIEWYYSQFPIITDLQINEVIKMQELYPKIAKILQSFGKGFKHELRWNYEEWTGTVDLLTCNDTDNSFNIFDFKYSNNSDYYMKSNQLHIYKYFLEKLGYKIDKLGFIFIPKTQIRQKKTEDLYQFRQRLKQTLSEMEVTVKYVDYDEQLVIDALKTAEEMQRCEEFEKVPNRLCDWCDFQNYCEKGEDLMILPKNERRKIDKIEKKVLWLYGAPFTGKTTLANQFPDPLMLNTDGNIKFVDSPFIPIKDEVTVEGRITKRKLAWDVFKESIEELERKQNDFKTIIVDLVEDTLEHCRLYMYVKLGIDHESDNSFKAWDMVRTEFLSTYKRLINMDYQNIILISHEDKTKDFTKKSGDKITSITPNLQDKSSLKIAGMVDIVGRVVAEGEERYIEFKPSEVVFGGGRLQFKETKLPLNYESLISAYDKAQILADGKTEEQPKTRRSI